MKIIIALSFVASAIAQTTGTLGGVIGPAPARLQLVGGGVSSVGSFAGMSEDALTGAPYSAEQITEHVQTLADGTHITQAAQIVTLYRDSQGRTRTERTIVLPPGAPAVPDPPSIVEISDPVTGARYVLDPRAHRATKMSLPVLLIPLQPQSPQSSAAVSAHRVSKITPMISLAPPVSGPNDQTRPQFSRESLGTQTMEGVLAEGSRTTVVYPVGSIGNDRPITTVSETWMSPELKMVVLSKNSDPRNGDSTTRLANISRTEPDPTLFQVPADYEVIAPQTSGPKQ
jgi:hypothetical protein